MASSTHRRYTRVAGTRRHAFQPAPLEWPETVNGHATDALETAEEQAESAEDVIADDAEAAYESESAAPDGDVAAASDEPADAAMATGQSDSNDAAIEEAAPSHDPASAEADADTPEEDVDETAPISVTEADAGAADESMTDEEPEPTPQPDAIAAGDPAATEPEPASAIVDWEPTAGADGPTESELVESDLPESAVTDAAPPAPAVPAGPPTIGTEPVDTEPVTAEPADAEPADAEPLEGELELEDETDQTYFADADYAYDDEIPPHADIFEWLTADQDDFTVDRPARAEQTVPFAEDSRLYDALERAVTKATAPPAPPPPETPTEAPQRPRPGAWSWQGLRWPLVAAAALLVAAVVAATVMLTRPDSGTKARTSTGQSTSHSAPATPQQIAAQQVSWVQQNLPPSASIVAPTGIATSLRHAGYRRVHADTKLAGLSARNVSFLVGEPTVSDKPGLLRNLISASAPLAIFESTASQTTSQTMIGEVFAGGAVTLERRLRADAKLRAEEGSDLLNNPNIHADEAMRKVFAGGLLDSRAGALITTLAIDRPVTVSDPERSGPEAAAGLPYRIFTIAMSDTVYLDNSINQAGQNYRPASSTKLGPDQRRLVWTPAVAPDNPA
jgi:hypothetical protein